jgi:hypothetical protein
MGDDALDEVRRLVVDDPALRTLLLSAPDRQSFIDQVVGLARRNGIALSPEEVAAGLSAARQHRRQRWV